MTAIKCINIRGIDNELIATYDSENNIITETYAAKTDVTVTVAADLSNLIIWRGTQSEYNALSEYDDNTLYIVTADIPYEPVAGDVVFYDNVTESKVVVPVDNVNIDDYPADRYTPIGVVVIPPSHDVYGTGEGAMISLKEMNYTTPDEGGTNAPAIRVGQYGIDTSLQNFNVFVTTMTVDSPTAYASGTESSVYLPSDAFSNAECPTDSIAHYYRSSSSYYAAPSPYLEDSSRNSVYYQTESPSSISNCLSDFNGIGNTEVLCDLATAQPNWKTDDTITNAYDSGYSPAACCCWRFHTEGTKQGDWYLPAEGELGYMLVRLKTINKTINKLINAYGSGVGVSVYTSGNYWSSSECSSSRLNYISFNNGHAAYAGKSDYYYVRSFSRIGGGVVKNLPLVICMNLRLYL